jgi:hypothetical protein
MRLFGSFIWPNSKRSEPEDATKNCLAWVAIPAWIRLGVGGREGGSKINADGLIVFPGGLRMYQRRRLNWRRTLQKVTGQQKGKSTVQAKLNYDKKIKNPLLQSVENQICACEHGGAGNRIDVCSHRQYASTPDYGRSQRAGQGCFVF